MIIINLQIYHVKRIGSKFEVSNISRAEYCEAKKKKNGKN